MPSGLQAGGLETGIAGRRPSKAATPKREMEDALARLRDLMPRDREVLTRVYLEEQSADQVCLEMGLTATQFLLIKSRAKALFADLVATKSIDRRAHRRVANLAPSRRATADPAELNRLIPVIAHAISVFGDERKAAHWLATRLSLLGDRSPNQMLASGRKADVQDVDRILTRIEYNIPS